LRSEERDEEFSVVGDVTQADLAGTEPAVGGDLEGEVNTRMCIVSRQTFEPEALIRFVAGPDGSVVPDFRRRLPGRGAHVEARREAVDLAVKRKLFGRALKRDVKAAESLGAEVDELLRRGALGFFGLARKAGEFVTGAAKVDIAIRTGRAIAVVHATDAAADGIRKLDNARTAAVALGDADPIPVFRSFTSDEMGLAFGGENVIHAAVLAGDAGAALLKRLEALSTYRGPRAQANSPQADAPNGRENATKTNSDHPQADGPGMDGGCGVEPAQEAEV
jgi:predicted RNA-binding protein YlxR (DUF448 family)